MKAIIEITLDDSWDLYKNYSSDLFLEDLFSTWKKDGVDKVELKSLV